MNPRWEVFKNNLLSGMGKQEAYEAVPGYKARGIAAATSASNLLKNPKFLKTFRKDLDRLKTKALITKDRVLKEERCIAYSDIGQIFNGEITIPPNELPEDVRRAVSACEIIEKEDPDGNIERRFKYKFWNKGQALDRLERHLGLFEKDNEQKGGDGVTIQVLIQNNGDG